MVFEAFSMTFKTVFILVMAVGPIFLTLSNVAMNRGFKSGFIAMLGSLISDYIYIFLGVYAAKAVVNNIPQYLMICLPLIASIYLIYLARQIWTTDIYKMKSIKHSTGSNLSLAFRLLCIGLSSPMSIIGYSVIFSSVIDATEGSALSVLLGGFSGTLFARIIIVSTFAFLGRKANEVSLILINRCSATLLVAFACSLMYKAICELLKVF